MANTSFPLNDPLAVKIWAKKLYRESLKQTWAYKFMGKDSSSIIQVYDELEKSAGDRITVGLRMLLTGVGIAGDSTLEGNEEQLQFYSDNLTINQLRNAVRSGGRISDQRVPFSVREEARFALQDWMADIIDFGFVNQVVGWASTSTNLTGMQTTTTYDAEHVVYTDGRTTEATVCSGSASAVFNLTAIDAAVAKAKTLTPRIKPVMVNGTEKYVCLLHPYQVRSMRTSTSTGQWMDITKAIYQGAKENNPIYSGALGEYNNVVLHESTRIPLTTSSGDGTAGAGNYRAVLCGAQAAFLAFGQENTGQKAIWAEEKFDYSNQLGVSAGLIWGLKKSIFNAKDFATIVINTFAKP
jgi:N4-gp56 family major capsid protein